MKVICTNPRCGMDPCHVVSACAKCGQAVEIENGPIFIIIFLIFLVGMLVGFAAAIK